MKVKRHNWPITIVLKFGLSDGDWLGINQGALVGFTVISVGDNVSVDGAALVGADDNSIGFSVSTVGVVDGCIVFGVEFKVGSVVGNAEGYDDDFIVGS